MLAALMMAVSLAVGALAPAFPHATQTVDPRVALPAAPLLQLEDRAFALEDLRGRWVWLYLGYSNCPDACPTTLAYLAAEYRTLQHPERVQPVFVSVDPARDTPDKLAAYVHYFHPAFLGVTGQPADLVTLAHGLGTRFQIGKPAKPGEAYVVEHPDVVFVLDPAGHLAAVYQPDGLAGAGALASDTDDQPAVGTFAVTSAPPELGTAAAWCGKGEDGDALLSRLMTQGSGTSVLPAAAPMRMATWQAGDWRLGLGGVVTAGVSAQLAGLRGHTDRAAENDVMLMGTRPWGPGLLDLHLMGSLEPLTVPGTGTPQLFQAGEVGTNGDIVDAMHPHDLLMELAARYTWNLDNRTALFIYGGPVGEPALGPTSYMHRPSATENRWAPLGHHFQDVSHDSYGVVTVGGRRDAWQLEASAFNGREPDEDHFNLDLAPLDSYAARLSYFPGASWSMQASLGYLRDVGAFMRAKYGEMPGMPGMGDSLRFSLSAINVRPTPWGPLSLAAIWGQVNDLTDGFGALQSYGLEGELDTSGGDHGYGRLELVDRPGFAALTPRVGALTLGFVHDLVRTQTLDLGIGADATAYSIDTSLYDIYGTHPFGCRVYLRLAPPLMDPGAGLMAM